MKKIMFNDRYGLTEAVIEKRKTVTRMLVSVNANATLKEYHGNSLWYELDGEQIIINAPYKVGEIVAVAQSYKDAGIDFIPFDSEKNRKWGYTHRMKAWTNKMFVYADLMPHKIRITGVLAVKLQDITDEDCLMEGVIEHPCGSGYMIDDIVYDKTCGDYQGSLHIFTTPKKAFSQLIDKISGRGTWNSNPFVWRIEFEYIN